MMGQWERAGRAPWAGVVAVMVLMACTARANLLLHESFDYADGPLVSVAAGIWNNYSGTSNQLSVAGGRAQLTQQASEDVQTFLTGRPHTNGTLYVSFKLNVSRTPSDAGACFALLKDTTDNSSRAGLYVSSASSPAGSYRVGIKLTGVTAPLYALYYDFDLSTNTDQRVVVRYDVNPPGAILWINPASEADYCIPALNGGEPLMGIHAFALRQSLDSGNGMGSLSVDDLRIGTSFADALAQGAPPALSPVPDQTIPAGGATGGIPCTVSDADTPLGQVTLSAASDSPGLIPLTNIVVHGTGSNRSVTISAAAGAQGRANITLQAVDGTGLSSSRTFLVRVGAPSLSTIADQVVSVNQPVGPLSFSVFDAENDPLQLTVTAADRNLFPGTNIVVNGTGTNRSLTLNPAAGVGGHTTITMILSDGIQKVTNRFEVTVAPRVGVVLADDFDYPDGPLVATGLNTWTNHSGTAGETLVAGGRLRLEMSLGEDVSAPLTNQPFATGSGYILYTRFDLEVTTPPTNANATYFAHFKDGGNGFRARLYLTTNGAPAGRYRLGISSAGATASAVATNQLVPGAVYTVVTRFNVNNGQSALWINPAQESDPATPAGDLAPSSTVVALAFRQTANIGAMWLDGLRVGTSFADVVAPPTGLQAVRVGDNVIVRWPANAGLRLQTAPMLDGTGWQDVPTPPATEGWQALTNQCDGSSRFYRLVK